MLECNYKGGLFEGLNQIMQISNKIEEEPLVKMHEQVPYGVNAVYCDGCDSLDCRCDDGCECGSQGCKGAAGYQDPETTAILGSEKSDNVGEMTTAQLVEESIVRQVQSIIKSNLEKCDKGDFDPLSYFKEPVKVDMYEPEIRYGDDMLK